MGTNLQALVIRMEAITGIGMYVKHGRSKKMTTKTIIPFINWLILNVAPLDTFTAVLTKTPVQGVAPSKPQTRFETASPFTSID